MINKIFCIGLGKTGTTTFGASMTKLGYRHHPTVCSYGLACYRSGQLDRLFALTKGYDSFDDFPWPLAYRELAEHFPDALFVLTVRSSAEKWYKSLCRHYDRTGPTLAKRLAYGHSSPYNDPDGHHQFYLRHISDVEDYFSGSDRLLKLCWEEGDGWAKIGAFLGVGHVPKGRIYHLKNLNDWGPEEELGYLVKTGQLDHAEKRAGVFAQEDPSVYDYFLQLLYSRDVTKGRIRQVIRRFVPASWRA